jgi:hypothetical protein
LGASARPVQVFRRRIVAQHSAHGDGEPLIPESTVNTNIYVIIEWCSTFGNTSTPPDEALLRGGNLSNVKTVGNGVLEYKVDFGPGYRIYFGRDGGRLVILLAGAMKKLQREDIRQARANWADYRNRKTQEETRCH